MSLICKHCNELLEKTLNDSQCPKCGSISSELQPVTPALKTIQVSFEDLSRVDAHPLPQDNLSHLVNQTLDRYQIKSMLGKGGMGWVFLAQHLQLNRLCALKILSPELIKKDLDYLERFHREGQSAASLNDPNIVTVHAIGEASGYHFLEMEFVPGRSLQSAIEQRLPSPTRAATIALGIATGLSGAHKSGVVHRDLKPDNVLLTHAGVPKIADFGLAKQITGRSAEMPGTLAGTPHFMAPELFSGAMATPASDVYALGVSLFVMLTGSVPFEGDKFVTLAHSIQHDPVPNIRKLRKDVPLELCEAVGMMLEKNPLIRPQNGYAAAQLLEAVIGQMRDLETLIKAAFKNEPQVSWEQSQQRFVLNVELPYGRSQSVIVETSHHHLSERLLQIFSLCCPATDKFYHDVLVINSNLPHGSLAIREINKKEFFVALANYPLGTADPEEIRRSVLELAECADAIELTLTGEDRN